MIIQKKYYMIILLTISSVSYGMDFNSLELFADLITRDPLDLYVAHRAAEIRRTTQEINKESRVAAKIKLGSGGHHELVERRGPIMIVKRIHKQEFAKPKL